MRVSLPVQTPRLCLRPLESKHAEGMSKLMTPSISRWVASWRYPFTLAAGEARIRGATSLNEARKALFLAIERRDDEAFIGCIGVHTDEHEPRRGGLGYWLGEDYQGNGYATEAASAILNVAFDFLDLDVIEAAAQPANAASLSIMRKLGMKPAGERMIFAPARGREELCVVYELKRLSA